MVNDITIKKCIESFKKFFKDNNIPYDDSLEYLYSKIIKGSPLVLTEIEIDDYFKYFMPVDDAWWCNFCEHILNDPKNTEVCPKCFKSNSLENIGEGYKKILKYLSKNRDQLTLNDLYISKEDIFAAFL